MERSVGAETMIDILNLHQRQKARRTAQSPSEYAASVQCFKRPHNHASRVLLGIAAVLLLAAWRLK
jgi:hypothetical protein